MPLPSNRTILLAAGLVLACSARADFEVTTPDGRRVLLKDNGTWQFVDATSNDQSGDATGGEAVLTLERKTDRGVGCRFAVRLVNNLSYEISSLVPYYAVYRGSGVIYDTVASPASFTGMKPGDIQNREFEVRGITCAEVTRVQVVGGDKCIMGELNKFTDGQGKCLARVRVVPSDIVRFEK
jgi:hypothetical protein